MVGAEHIVHDHAEHFVHDHIGATAGELAIHRQIRHCRFWDKHSVGESEEHGVERDTRRPGRCAEGDAEPRRDPADESSVTSC